MHLLQVRIDVYCVRLDAFKAHAHTIHVTSQSTHLSVVCHTVNAWMLHAANVHSTLQVRIDVYCVRLNAFKAYVEEMIKRLRETLAASLRKRVSLA